MTRYLLALTIVFSLGCASADGTNDSPHESSSPEAQPEPSTEVVPPRICPDGPAQPYDSRDLRGNSVGTLQTCNDADGEPEKDSAKDIPLCDGEKEPAPGDCQTLVYDPASGYCNRWHICD